MSNYNHIDIENKWSKKWLEEKVYEAIDFSPKPKKYILAEFPYPSGKSLHAGHMMRYTVPDTYARYLRMKGYNVMFPIGWDAFGLPAEIYAIKTGNHPEVNIKETTTHYKESFIRMGYGIDWDREINTTDPKYYKWTQWIFLKMYKENLAEYKEMPVWWCENLKTVLADEEVLTDKDGNKISERGEHPVERKMLSQWVLKMPLYAQKLIDGLNDIDFPESIKNAQINWIGKSQGAEVKFYVKSLDLNLDVFTTRPDTIFGVSYIAIAPDNPILDNLLRNCTNKGEVIEYINNSKNKSNLERVTNKEKTGVLIDGIYATHPFKEFDKEILIFVSDYVLMDYGTGVVMGVPAHDERDFEFANKFNLPYKTVITKTKGKPLNSNEIPYIEKGYTINSYDYDDLTSEEFTIKVNERLQNENKGISKTIFKLRDWVFSRQRYWGEPIPLIHMEDGSTKPICDVDNINEVNEKLPLVLPELSDYSPSEDGTAPLSKNKDWVNIEIDGKKGKREINTMPNWAGSCWYYLRYIDPNNDKYFADNEKLKYWLPVDKYFGGAEHVTLHLLYSRFWHQFLYDQGLVPTPEPYNWRLSGGMLLGPDGKKMSKSKGNVVEPMDVVEKYGADALRMFICFLGPYEDTYPWNDNGVKATNKFIKTLFELNNIVKDEVENDIEILKAFHKMIYKVTNNIENLKMNTCISEFMIFQNILKQKDHIGKDIWGGFLKVLAPFIPFVTEELWNNINLVNDSYSKDNSIHLSNWPEYDEKYLKEDKVVIPIQVNGKLRGNIEIEMDLSEDSVLKIVKSSNEINQYIENKEIKKIIYIKNKIVNIVI